MIGETDRSQLEHTSTRWGGVKLRYLLPHEFPKVDPPLDAMSVEGDFTRGRIHVAIVGARAALPTSVALATRLAEIVARNSGVVVSGGANGVDAAAHGGAIDAGGRTWAVLGCGAPNLTPSGRKLADPLRFERILASGGAIIRPFPHDTPAMRPLFLSRNRVTMALADIVVVIQAADRSGTWHAANRAREMNKEIWVVPGMGAPFVGSWDLVRKGGRVMRSEEEFADRVATASAPPSFDGDCGAVFDALGPGARHPDEIAAETGLSTAAVAAALLTLALGDVVVEGSAGLFQRK